METRQRNQYGMYGTVREWLSTHREEIKDVPALGAAIDDFNALLARFEDTIALQATAATGLTEVKGEAHESLVSAVLPVRAALTAYARRAGQTQLRVVADFSESAFRTMRHREQWESATIIHQHAAALKDALAPFGVTAADIDALRDAIAAFDVSMNTKDVGIVRRRTARHTLESLAGEIDRLLTEQLDVIFEVFRKKNPALFTGYKAARTVHNLGVRHEAQPPAAPPAPVQ
jgi:hypothetical protein